jgi:hypothetical protein
MIDRESKTAVDEPLDPLVERAATQLRRPESVRQAWREELLAQVSTPPRARRASLRVWIPVAIAAGLVAAVGMRQLAGRGGEDRIRFSVSAPSAKQVSLVGDFNRWNPAAVPMRRGSRDVWIVDVRLQPGRHVFAFSVDGALRADSAAPRAVEDDFGVPGSVVVVPGRGSD